MSKISIIIPVFNEEKNISPLYTRLVKTLKQITKSYEIIFVDDGSQDKSLYEISKLRRKDHKVKFISFSRNFGHMPAVSAGIAHTRSEYTVIMDADLQDPPEIISLLYKQAKKGYEVVYAVKKQRKEGFFKVLLFNSFYKILNLVSTYKMPLDAGTFCIVNKRVITALNSLPEKNKYFSGLRAWTGFSQIGIVYERDPRLHGKASSFWKLARLALNGIFSFSYIPLRLASLFGFFIAFIALIGIILVIILRLYFGIGFIGWASTMVTILLLAGVQLITLGIIGEYLARIYDEVKNRPEYLIQKMVGFKR